MADSCVMGRSGDAGEWAFGHGGLLAALFQQFLEDANGTANAQHGVAHFLALAIDQTKFVLAFFKFCAELCESFVHCDSPYWCEIRIGIFPLPFAREANALPMMQPVAEPIFGSKRWA